MSGEGEGKQRCRIRETRKSSLTLIQNPEQSSLIGIKLKSFMHVQYKTLLLSCARCSKRSMSRYFALEASP